MRCRFCDSNELRKTHAGLSHPKKSDHGPFDLHACKACGSIGTWPPPSPAGLAALYGSFASGVDPTLRELRADAPLTAWFAQVVSRTKHMLHLTGESTFRWLDVGAGGGELSLALAGAFPLATGVAIDWAARPSTLEGSAGAAVDWHSADLNATGFSRSLPKAELVISLSVWEHVIDPFAFVAELLDLVAPGGLLYLVCPDAGSLAARILRSRWPYFIPGEHLNMPTARGARRCLHRAGVSDADIVRVGPVGLPYPPSYVLGFLGLRNLSRIAHALPAVPLPVGALETVCRRPR